MADRSDPQTNRKRLEATWQSSSFDRLGAAMYDFIIERQFLARPIARALWGTDIRRLFDLLKQVSGLPPGSRVLDIACGGGLAFRALSPELDLNYTAVDLSPGMLKRAKQQAERRGLDQIVFVQASVDDLPFAEGTFDLVLSLNSLHCFSDPAVALAELGRRLRPGGRLLGDSVIRGAGWRFDRTYHLLERRNVFGPGGTLQELREWLSDAGLRVERLESSGAVASFEARRLP